MPFGQRALFVVSLPGVTDLVLAGYSRAPVTWVGSVSPLWKTLQICG